MKIQKMIRFLCVIYFLLVGYIYGQSTQIAVQDSLADKHHVIIMMDRSAGMIYPQGYFYNNNSIARQNKEQLGKLLDEVEKICNSPINSNSNRKLLDKGDYLSFAGFGLHDTDNYYDNDFTNFILKEDKYKQNRTGGLHKFGYRFLNKTTSNRTTFEKIKNSVINTSGFFNKHWGVISVARPLAMCVLTNPNKSIGVGKTFVIMITDREYNDSSGDPIQELLQVQRWYKDKGRTLDISFALKNINLLNESYVCKSVNPKSPVVYTIKKKNGGKYDVSLFEYIPLQKYFSIESVFHFPSKIYCNRTLNGYRAKIDFSPIPTNYYTPIQMQGDIYVANKDTVIDKFSHQFSNPIQEFTKSFQIPREYASKTDSLRLKFWLHFNDEAYGNSILSPDGSDLQGAQGLKRVLPLEFEPDVNIFGFLPLSDNMFEIFSYGNKNVSQEEVKDRIHFWSGIFIFLLLVILLLIYIVIKRKVSNLKEE